jgi:hypothetical protein
MQVVNFHTGKTSYRDDKMATFELWKAKLLLKDIRNQLQLPKATLRRILKLLRTVWRIHAQEPYLEPEDSGGANAKEAESVYQQRRTGHPVLKCIFMGEHLFSVSMAFSELLTVFYCRPLSFICSDCTLQSQGGCAAVHPITSLNTHARPPSPWRGRFPSTPVTCTAAAPALAGLAASFLALSRGTVLPPPPVPHAGGSAAATLRASRHFWSTKFQKASSMASLIQTGRSFSHWRQSVGGILARMPGSV